MEVLSILAGWTGMVLLVLAYALLSAKKLSSHSLGYNLLNLLGGIGLLVNTISGKSWPAAALNALWAIIALITLFKLERRNL